MADDQQAGQRMLVDMHVHTRHSDGQPTVAQVEAFCVERGVGAVITDHNEIRGSLDLCGRGSVPTLAGIEVGTKEGFEFLTYFSDPGALEDFYLEAVEPHLYDRFMVRSRIQSIAVLEAARARGAWISLAHPFAFGRKSMHFQTRKRGKAFCDRVFEFLDGVEVFNGGIPRGANRKAESLRDCGKHLTAGSDSHTLSTYGTSGMYFPVEAATPAHLHAHLRELASLGLQTGFQCSVTKTVLLIATNHTKFFLRGRRALRLSHEQLIAESQ